MAFGVDPEPHKDLPHARRTDGRNCTGCSHPFDWHSMDRAIEPPCLIMDQPIPRVTVYAHNYASYAYPICYCEGFK